MERLIMTLLLSTITFCSPKTIWAMSVPSTITNSLHLKFQLTISLHKYILFYSLVLNISTSCLHMIFTQYSFIVFGTFVISCYVCWNPFFTIINGKFYNIEIKISKYLISIPIEQNFMAGKFIKLKQHLSKRHKIT